MTIRETPDRVFPEYHITKRNVRVDSAVIVVPQLGETLLGYFNIRNADYFDYMKSSLTSIYNFLEPKRKEYKGMASSAVSEEFFTGMNTFGIRHNTKSQIRMQTKKKMAVCDKLFMMAVYVLQTVEINKYKDELKAL